MKVNLQAYLFPTVQHNIIKPSWPKEERAWRDTHFSLSHLTWKVAQHTKRDLTIVGSQGLRTQVGLSQFPQCLLHVETGNVYDGTQYLVQHTDVHAAAEHHFSAAINPQPVLSRAATHGRSQRENEKQRPISHSTKIKEFQPDHRASDRWRSLAKSKQLDNLTVWQCFLKSEPCSCGVNHSCPTCLSLN